MKQQSSETTISGIAAVFVLFTALLNPLASVLLAVFFLLILTWYYHRKNNKKIRNR